jgi:uncharacterized protein
MNLYADTSGLAKIVLNEEGAQEIVEAIAQPGRFISVAIAYAELRSAVAGAIRGGRIQQTARDSYVRSAEDLWRLVYTIAVEDALIQRAGNLAELFGLRAYHAVHLAALQSAGDPDDIVFAGWDRVLRRGAEGLGYQLLPEQL